MPIPSFAIARYGKGRFPREIALGNGISTRTLPHTKELHPFIAYKLQSIYNEDHLSRISIDKYYIRVEGIVDEGSQNYDFSERRALVFVSFRFGAHPWGPAVTTPKLHVPLDWGGAEPSGDSESDAIQDLLRQDEELRRSSSCVGN